MDSVGDIMQLFSRSKAFCAHILGGMITFLRLFQFIGCLTFVIIYITNISSILPKCLFFLKIHNIFYTFKRIYLKNFSLFCNFHHFLSFYSQNMTKIKICISPFFRSGRCISKSIILKNPFKKQKIHKTKRNFLLF